MRVAEEEDRRLLMPASYGCFRFMVDVERLSTSREEERQTREAEFTLETSQWGRVIGCTQRRTRLYKILIPLIRKRQYVASLIGLKYIHKIDSMI